MDLSIVTTLYESANYLKEFHKRVSDSARTRFSSYELIFVNDGSPDNSLEVVLELQTCDSAIKIIELARNFGHHKAIMTGLQHAQGDLVFLIDCDLEEAPELLETFTAELNEKNVDVVYGIQSIRKGRVFERFSGYIFYRVFNSLSETKITPNLSTVRLMTQAYVTNVIRHRDRTLFLAGILATTGFKQAPIIFSKLSKERSSYTFARKVNMLVDSVTSFSSKPLVYISFLGLSVSLIALVAALYIGVRRLLFNDYLIGWPSLVVSTWFLAGLIILCQGVVGLYLSKIFIEVKRRPLTVVRKIHEVSRNKSA